MQTVVATLVVFCLVALAMSIGSLLGRQPLQGSCGGSGSRCPCTEQERQACEHRERGAA